MRKDRLFSILLLLLLFWAMSLLAEKIPPPEKPDSGTFFQVEKNIIDTLYFLNLSSPPQIKKVIAAPRNAAQTVVAEADSFDLSPNGKQLVYSVSGRLQLTRIDGREESILTKGKGSQPKWSNNGELIAFISSVNSRENLGLMDKLGINAELVFTADKLVNFFWENNSESLLLIAKMKDIYYLIRLYPDARKDVIYQFAPQVVVKAGALSPDGTKMAYVSSHSQGDGETVFLIDLNVYKLFRLSRPFRKCTGLSWSEDSKSLIFSADNALYVVQGAKGNIYKLQENAKSPVWSRNSGKIVYLKADNPAKAVLYNLKREYLQDLDLGNDPKTNLILIEKQISLSDIQVASTNGENITYSLKKKTERQKITEGMILPLNSSVRTDAFSSVKFLLGKEVEVSVSPKTEVKISESGGEGYFEELGSKRELAVRVLEGQIKVKDGSKEKIVNSGEEYVISLRENESAKGKETSSNIPASLLLERLENLKQKTTQKTMAKGAATAAPTDVTHPHGEEALNSDCLKCHPTRPDWTRVDYKTVEFTLEAAATCINCHRPGEPFREMPYNKHNFMSDPNRCLDCHREKPIPGVDNYRTVTFVDTIVALCISCHNSEDIGPTHPVGMVPKIKKYISNVRTPDVVGVMDIPSDLHLDENGLMTCVTCHEAHGKWRSLEKPYVKEDPLGEIFGQGYYHNYFLRRNNFNSGLCVACHGQAGY